MGENSLQNHWSVVWMPLAIFGGAWAALRGAFFGAAELELSTSPWVDTRDQEILSFEAKAILDTISTWDQEAAINDEGLRNLKPSPDNYQTTKEELNLETPSYDEIKEEATALALGILNFRKSPEDCVAPPQEIDHATESDINVMIVKAIPSTELLTFWKQHLDSLSFRRLWVLKHKKIRFAPFMYPHLKSALFCALPRGLPEDHWSVWICEKCLKIFSQRNFRQNDGDPVAKQQHIGDSPECARHVKRIFLPKQCSELLWWVRRGTSRSKQHIEIINRIHLILHSPSPPNSTSSTDSPPPKVRRLETASSTNQPDHPSSRGPDPCLLHKDSTRGLSEVLPHTSSHLPAPQIFRPLDSSSPIYFFGPHVFTRDPSIAVDLLQTVRPLESSPPIYFFGPHVFTRDPSIAVDLLQTAAPTRTTVIAMTKPTT